jgi:phosphatidate cytidylyltransferase
MNDPTNPIQTAADLVADSNRSADSKRSADGTESTGVIITGAQSARSALQSAERAESRPSSPSQWADDGDSSNDGSVIDLDDPSAANLAATGQLTFGSSAAGGEIVGGGADDDEEDGIHSAWMDAGDTTLGDLLGHVPQHGPDPSDSHVRVSIEPAATLARDTNPVVDSLASENTDAANDTHDADDEDDVFPAHMYTNQSSSAASLGEDTGVIVAAAAATLERRDRRIAERHLEDANSEADLGNSAGFSDSVDDAPAPRKRRDAAADNPDGDWGAFAGSGPRWRDDAKDWADIDAADTSLLGDDETRVGTLDAKRSERSDLYSIDPSDGADADAEDSATDVAKPSNVLRFDSLIRDVEPQARLVSGGPQQRSDRRKVARDDQATGAAAGPESAADGSRAASPDPRLAQRRPAANTRGRAPQSSISARIGTGALLLLVVALVFIFGKAVGASILAALAITMAAIELMHALRERGFKPAIPAVALGLLSIVGGGMWRAERGVMVALVLSMASIACWYLFGAERERPAVNMAASFLSFGYPAIAAASAALLLQAPNGVGLLMPAIVCTVAHDVFAYAGGRLIGRTHFTDISPNKTIEGLVIGIFGSVAVSVAVFGKLTVTPWVGFPQAIALGLAIGVAAPIGDLVESMLKRDLNVKDMGNLLPGHGGVFDRIDAMMLAVPATWLVAVACGHL